MQDKGTLSLSVKLHNETILIDIEDDGCSVPLEYPERIFEPFSQPNRAMEALRARSRHRSARCGQALWRSGV